MPGFFISNQKTEIELHNRYDHRCLAEELPLPDWSVKRNTLNRFLQDKAFAETPEAILVAEGYLLNKKELFETYGVNDVAALMWRMYQQEGETFFSSFRGAFSGALFDRKENKWLIYTNHIGECAVFYMLDRGNFWAGSQVNYLIDAARAAGKTLTFQEQAAYQMLTFGFMEGDDTYAKEIRRLRGGTYLRVKEGKAEVLEYHRFRRHPERFAAQSESEIIDALDTAFRQASELEYRKDDEYGYHHLTDLSGGLDSRINMWVAHQLHPRHLHLMTYCKANYADEIIAKQIAAYFHDEITVKALDDLSYLYEIDEITAMNGGLSLYSGITGGKRMLEDINMDLYGLEHTGQINGAVIGSYLPSRNRKPSGMYSEVLKDRLTGFACDEYEDHELYMLYTRGFRGIMNTQQIRNNYTECCTTSANPDFLQLCMDIPVELRVGHALYKKWILSRYPEAAKFKWEKTGARITENPHMTFLKKLLRRGPVKLYWMLAASRKGSERIRTGMNPLDYWLERNDNARAYLDNYEKNGYSFLPADASAQLIQDMKQLYRTGNASEKAMVLTVLASAKLYFGETA